MILHLDCVGKNTSLLVAPLKRYLGKFRDGILKLASAKSKVKARERYLPKNCDTLLPPVRAYVSKGRGITL